ncbi:UDP-glucose dehydrogenase family protein [Planctobacterium marinum]|uniref:UDP-glucose 6-dehydrogenase n=1 Tax=Planctobacterium marinum TaxID=1631968 RepID=A0AA48HXE5_9ALTE|nr:UDP-glucose 6-dehydrogenase [Planctobacterium marinum]
MRVTVFGIGYVGLVQAAVLADLGNTVTCVDIEQSKVDALKEGHIPIFEPGLEPMVKNNYRGKRLLFTTDAKTAVDNAEVIFIAVGTPMDQDGSADLQYVLKVAETIGQNLTNYSVVVNKSTVPVGTGDKVEAVIKEQIDIRGSDIDFDVVSNPEFLKEGAAIADCSKPDRIILGSNSAKALGVMHNLYAPFNRNHKRTIVMDRRSAELTKYAANCMLATKISFMNEMANIAEQVGADIEMVRNGIGSDPRIGYHFIYPGCGYGGSCFPKDVNALIKTSLDHGHTPQILQSVESVNAAQKIKLEEMVYRHYGTNLAGTVIAVWGGTFKPNTDDIREAPSLVAMSALLEKGATIRLFDPIANEALCAKLGNPDNLFTLDDPMEALTGSDGLMICTEWKMFKAPDFNQIKQSLNHPVIFDGRNLYDPETMTELGIDYYAIGRGKSVKRFD